MSLEDVRKEFKGENKSNTPSQNHPSEFTYAELADFKLFDKNPVDRYYQKLVASGRGGELRPYILRFDQYEIDGVNEVALNESGGKANNEVVKLAKARQEDRPIYKDLVQQQTEKQKENKSEETVASSEKWDQAWKDKTMGERLDNYQKNPPTHPDPLLVNKIAALPPGDPRRQHHENLKGVIDGTTGNVGNGVDTLSREGYKDVKMLVKQSPMLQAGINKPDVMPTKDNMVGSEEGKPVNNMQGWGPALANAVKPVSDAVGSHADTSSSINKNPMGPDQLLPQAATAQVKAITPDMVKDVENSFKATQRGTLLQTPAKDFGSLRQLMTCSIPSLSFPFDLVSDIFNGLMGLIKSISKLIDGIMTQIKTFAISALGGLLDGLFPIALLQKLIAFVSKLANQVAALFDLLAGFAALRKASNKIAAELPLGCTDNIFESQRRSGSSSAKTNTFAKLADKARQVAGVASTLGSVVAGLPSIGGGLGNLGAMIGGFIPKDLGALTANISHPNELLKGMFDEKINKLLKNLPWCCAVGCTGNNGYSIGELFDKLRDTSYTLAMSTWAAHASIISPLFNKKATEMGKFAQLDSLFVYEKQPFAKGAEGNKGVTMYGPDSTKFRKIFRLGATGGVTGMGSMDATAAGESNSLSPRDDETNEEYKARIDAQLAANEAANRAESAKRWDAIDNKMKNTLTPENYKTWRTNSYEPLRASSEAL